MPYIQFITTGKSKMVNPLKCGKNLFYNSRFSVQLAEKLIWLYSSNQGFSVEPFQVSRLWR